MVEHCPNCGQATNTSFTRLVKDTCGHSKCRLCLLQEEQGCKLCKSDRLIKNIGNFDYPQPNSVENPTVFNSELKSNLTTIKNTNVSLLPELVITKVPNNLKQLPLVDFVSAETGITEETVPERDLIVNESDNINYEENERVSIPKIEPYEMVSSIGSHLNDDFVSNSLNEPISCEREEKEKLVPPKRREKDKDKNRVSITRDHIIVIPGDPKNYKCSRCNRVFTNKKSMCYHDACVTGIKPFFCHLCDKSFVKKSHFEYHQRVHSGLKPFKCTLCEKAFIEKSKLNRHMFSHRVDKFFTCRVCGKKYSQQHDLKSHLNLHNGKTHTCKLCNKSFLEATNLKRHMSTTHASERPHSCDKCGKKFKDKSVLSRHKITHKKERAFCCDHCKSLFSFKSELKRHMAVHSGAKPFRCKFCSTVFRRKDNLFRHIRHHHMEDSNNARVIPTTQSVKKQKLTKSTAKASKVQQNCQQQNQQQPKKITRRNSGSKSPKLLCAMNSRDQINSRLDSMGNITPVIRTTYGISLNTSSNAVPVINGPITFRTSSSTSTSIENKTEVRRKTFNFTEPIPVAEAVVLNKRIEEKLYSQNNSRNYYFNNDAASATNLMTTIQNNNFKNNYPDNIETQIEKEDSDAKSKEFIDRNVTSFVKQDFVDRNNCVSTIKHVVKNEEMNFRASQSNESLSNQKYKNSEMHWRRRTAENLRPSSES